MDIKTRDAQPHLVIYGHITDAGGERNGVDISRSSGYFSVAPPEPIRGARVTVSDGEKIHTLNEHPDQPGFYIPGSEGLYPLPDAEYTLDVEVDFNGNGEFTRYRARTATSRQTVIHDVELERSTVLGNDNVQVLLTATLPHGGLGHYNVHMWMNDGTAAPSRSRFTLFRGEDLTTNELERLPIYWLDQRDEESRLRPGDNVTVALDAITADYSDFLSYAQRETSASIPFFSAPPANLPTNIERMTPGDVTPLAGYFTSLLRSSYGVSWMPDATRHAEIK